MTAEGSDRPAVDRPGHGGAEAMPQGGASLSKNQNTSNVALRTARSVPRVATQTGDTEEEKS